MGRHADHQRVGTDDQQHTASKHRLPRQRADRDAAEGRQRDQASEDEERAGDQKQVEKGDLE